MTLGMKDGSINLLTPGMKDGSKIAKQRLDFSRSFSRSFSANQVRSFSTNPFNKELDLKYKLDKLTKTFSASFRVEDLYNAKHSNNIDNIKNLILHKLDNNTLYTTYIKIRYSNNLFMMAGNQIGFKYNSDIDLHELINVFTERIQQCLDKYELDSDEIVYVQLLFRKVNTSIITEFSKEEVKSFF